MNSELEKFIERLPWTANYTKSTVEIAVKAAFAEVERRAYQRCDDLRLVHAGYDARDSGACDECFGIACKQLQAEWFGGKSEESVL